MAARQDQPAARAAGYQLEGTLREVCSCETLCPCWIGEDPDQGTCDTVIAYNLTSGTIRGVDVRGLSLVTVGHIPGDGLAGNWRLAMYVTEEATDEQMNAMLDAFGGK